MQNVLYLEFILLDRGLDHAEELPPVLMLHNVKGFKDLEATAEGPDLSRLHLDVPDGDLCCFVELLGVILVYLPSQLDEELLRLLLKPVGAVIEFYEQLVHNVLN